MRKFKQKMALGLILVLSMITTMNPLAMSVNATENISMQENTTIETETSEETSEEINVDTNEVPDTDPSSENSETPTETTEGAATEGLEMAVMSLEGISQITKVMDARAITDTAVSVSVQGVVTFVDGKNVYLEDETGGIDLYLSTADTSITVGATLTATGTRTAYNGLEEILVAPGDYTVGEPGVLPATEITLDVLYKDMETDNLDSYEARRIFIKDAVIGKQNPKGNTTITQNGTTINIYKLPELAGVEENATISFYAVVGDYKGVQLRVYSSNDVTNIKNPVIVTLPEGFTDPISAEMVLSAGAKTIAQVLAMDTSLKSVVTVIGQITHVFGNGTTMNSAIIQDIEGNEILGLQIYNALAAQKVGDIVAITGTLGTYGGVTQISAVTAVTLISDKASLFPAQEVTLADISAAGNSYISEYVVLKNVTLGDYLYAGTKITDQTGSFLSIYRGFPFPESVKAQDTIDFYGVASAYNATAQLRCGSATCYVKPVEAMTVDTSVTMPLVSWAGTEQLAYGPEFVKVPGDIYADNDKLDLDALFSISTGVVPQYSYSSSGVTTYVTGSKGIAEGQYYQLEFPTIGYGNPVMNFTMRGSNTGAKFFQVYYSVDGVNFTKADNINYTIKGYNYAASEAYSTTYQNKDVFEVTASAQEYQVILPAEVNHQAKVYLRVQVASSESINGAVIKATGVNRFYGISLTGNPVKAADLTSYVVIQPSSGEVPTGTELTMSSQTPGAEIYYSLNGAEYQIYNEQAKPVLTTDQFPATVRVYGKKAGLLDSIPVTNKYTMAKLDSVQATPNGGSVRAGSKVKLSCAISGASIFYSFDTTETKVWLPYTESILLETLPAVLYAKATKDGFQDSEISEFKFELRENEKYNIYFGQLHSHTNVSDGMGTVEEAFTYASKQAEQIDFLAITDHSNLFDNDTQATIKDGSMSTEWVQSHSLADQFTDENFVAIYGYEMTWSGGTPGHMNTFNTDGFLSRNTTNYTNGAKSSLTNYYEQLKLVPDSISMFNHPGNTFGDFYDFGYYDEEIDKQISLIEVGNGEGAIGSSGYFASYEYYTRALDKGWHVAPTNNQDNHKGLWGDANTGRTVVLADTLTRDSIYDALRNMRTYATEDHDLKIWYTLNGADMGTIFETVQSDVDIQVEVEDLTDPIGKVEVIVNGGLSVASKNVSDKTGLLTFDLEADYSYYYIRVTELDGDIAVTAPVWISEVEAAGISGLTTEASLAVKGEAIDLTTKLFNNEEVDLLVNKVEYTMDGTVIHTADLVNGTLSKVSPKTEVSETFYYTSDKVGKKEIKVTVYGTLNGVEKKYTSSLILTFVDPSIITRVLVDGTHNNDYVTGYYGGNVGNFADLAAEEYVQVTVVKDKITAEMLKDCSLLIVSAPAKKTGTFAGASYGTSSFEESFVSLVKDYMAAGGNIIVCGLADYSDSASVQSSVEINKLLTAIGASTRLNSDEMVDDSKNGGQNYRLYFTEFNRNSPYLAGVTENQVYSAYSGCSVLVQNTPDVTVDKLVVGHSTTYSLNTKTFGESYQAVTPGDIVALTSETLSSGGKIFTAGTVFISDFEVKSALDNAGDSYYANRNILLNILKTVQKEQTISTIAELRKGNIGEIFTIEGRVTAGTATPGNIFFDTIYVQDETGGTTVFPIADSGIALGTKLRITGSVDSYQGDLEIQVLQYEILDSELTLINPLKVTTKQAADYKQYGGMLLKVEGTVSRIIKSSSGIEAFFVKDASGVEAKVFVDGYILAADGTDTIEKDVVVGNEVSAVGLSYYNPDGACLRVRNRDEIVFVKVASTETTTKPVTNSGTANTSATNTGIITEIEDVLTPSAAVPGTVARNNPLATREPIVIEEEATPLSPSPAEDTLVEETPEDKSTQEATEEIVQIEEEEVPLVVATDNENTIMIYLGIALLLLLIGGGLIIYIVKTKKVNEAE